MRSYINDFIVCPLRMCPFLFDSPTLNKDLYIYQTPSFHYKYAVVFYFLVLYGSETIVFGG